VGILWGAKDPWEKVEWGRQLKEADTVVEYIEFPDLGHCPHDEGPEQVNPEIYRFANMYG
jgi:pimeloyl-ACP methyl ester carboxylesterase